MRVTWEDDTVAFLSAPFQSQPVDREWVDYELPLLRCQPSEPGQSVLHPGQSIVRLELAFSATDNLLWSGNGVIQAKMPRLETPPPVERIGRAGVMVWGSTSCRLIGPDRVTLTDLHPDPQGQWLVFQAIRADANGDGALTLPEDDKFSELGIMRTDGTGCRLLTWNQCADLDPAWTRDSTRIIWAGHPGGICSQSLDLLEIDPIKEEITALTQTPEEDDRCPQPAADGTLCWAVVSGDKAGIRQRDADGRVAQLTSARRNELDLFPRCSPNGSNIVFQRVSLSREYPLAPWALWVMSAGGGGQHQLTSPLPGLQADQNPTWLADSSRLLFWREDDRRGQTGPYVTDAAAPKTRALPAPADMIMTRPDWFDAGQGQRRLVGTFWTPEREQAEAPDREMSFDELRDFVLQDLKSQGALPGARR
jgi:hypothetical protein